MEVVAGSLLSAAFEVLLGKLASPELLRFARQEKVFAELEEWKKELSIINEVLDEAEEKQISRLSVKVWLDDLRDLAYDMEDVVDEFATELLRRRLIAQEPATSKVWSTVPTFFTTFNPVGDFKFRVKIGSKIKEITGRLDDISSRKAKLGMKMVGGVDQPSSERFASGSASTWQRPPSTSLINEPIHGRVEEKKMITDLLFKDDAGESNFGIIPIVGIGGIGKTTLAQIVYKDDEVVKHFDPKVWICVSDESDIVKITEKILNAIPDVQIGDWSDFDQVQVKLSKNLAGKKFLLVLDDVWNIRNYEQWDSLRAPFNSGARGSKIIITTRDTNVASLMRADNYHHFLQPLSDDDCWPVFVKHAFDNKNVDEYPNLKEIGRKIVKKCSGLPLAAKLLGGLLRSKLQEAGAWEHVLNSKIWNLPGIIPALRLSYQNLPPHLKRCFAYCALFPRDYQFKQKELILLWMAEGLIHQPKEDDRQKEDLGADYFQELLSRLFFQPSSSNESSIEASRFMMHDLINDLAKAVAGELSFNLENNEMKGNKQHIISQRTRRASFIRSECDVFKKFEIFSKLENLRTLVALPTDMGDRKCYLTTKVFNDLLPKLRQLRVLSLSCYEIKKLPKSIGDLKQLRYLNLSHTALRRLPESVCDLYNLQTLLLSGCKKLAKLPKSIGNLTNLRHLDVSGSVQLEKMPPQIGELVNLRTLSKFVICEGDGLRIKDLKNFLNLRGELSISGLQNVVDTREAREANLKDRCNIEKLMMEWSSDFGNSRNYGDEMEVLQLLQPHQSLEDLTVAFYGGSMFPQWIGDPSFSRMTNLTLKNCENCTSLPALGRLSLLKSLKIEGMNKIRSIGIEFYGEIGMPFPSLEFLIFENMPEWEDWFIPKLVDETKTLFRSLNRLQIRKCPRLINLPGQLPSLEELFIEECQELKVNKCHDEGLLKSWVVDVPSLTGLYLRGISRLSCLWEGYAQSLTALEELEINRCDELACLQRHGCGLETLGGVLRLWIRGCDGVVSLEEQGLPYNLQYLKVDGCGNLEKLPNVFHTLTSLTMLVIVNCRKLVSLPEMGLPPMLRLLTVKDCEGLKSLPDGMMTNRCVLEFLSIEGCPSLIGFPEGELSPTLRYLEIIDCQEIASLPEGIMHHQNNSLESLFVKRCSSLKSMPRGEFPSSLSRLVFWKCQQLEAIPGKMLQNLTSLQYLFLCNCPDLVSSPEAFLTPNLKSLGISDGENMPLFAWDRYTLASVEEIMIHGRFPDVVSFSDDGPQFLLPPSLIQLHISGFQNLRSIASFNLQSLISLKKLYIRDCPKLQSFVPKEGLPPTLGTLYIVGCPILERRCIKGKGKDWHKIAHIPKVQIGGI